MGRRFPIRVGVDAIDGAWFKALVAPRTELGNDDDVEVVVEDGSEVGGAGSKAGVAVNAHVHVDSQRRVLPQRLPLFRFETISSRHTILQPANYSVNGLV